MILGRFNPSDLSTAAFNQHGAVLGPYERTLSLRYPGA
jgi:hypothetical protein